MTSYTFSPFDVFGCVEAIPSKSVAHRVLIAAALADVATDVVLNGFTSADIEATIRCIKALGAIVQPLDNGLRVVPGKSPIGQALFDCGEVVPRFVLCCQLRQRVFRMERSSSGQDGCRTGHWANYVMACVRMAATSLPIQCR